MPYRVGVLIGILTWVVYSGVAAAETRYVSDQLSINMRRGPGTGYRISHLLAAGDKLETLSEAKGWTKVRTVGGDTGYVLTRFLSDEPTARAQLAALKQANQQLKAELAQATQGSTQLGERKRDLVADNKSLKSQLQHIKEVSADAIRISQENQKYRKQLMSLRSDVDRLRHGNQALASRREGMKIGALILVAGVIVGLLLPLFRRRRKNNWDAL